MLGRVNTILFDLDGTIALGDRPISDSVSRLNAFLELPAKSAVLTTNNTSRTVEAYRLKLARLGLNAERIEIVTPVSVASAYLAKRFNTVHVLGTLQVIDELRQRGLEIDTERADCVLLTFDTSLSYESLSVVTRLVANGVPYFLTHPDVFCPSELGPIPDCGAIGRLVEATTGVRPMGHFGKPGAHYVRYLKRLLGSRVESALMVGDRQSTDVRLGNRLRIPTVWVRSGDATVDPRAKPDAILPTFAEMFGV